MLSSQVIFDSVQALTKKKLLTKVTHVLSFQTLHESDIKILKNYNINIFPRNFRNQDDVIDFIHTYADLVAEIAKVNDSVLWWATDLSSKSRFSSLVPDKIDQALKVLQALKQSEGMCLLVLGSSDSIISTVRMALDNKVRVISSGYCWRYFTIYMMSVFRRIGSVVRHVLWTWNRIYRVRKILGKKLKYWKKHVSSDEHYVIKSFTYNHSFDEHGNYCDIFFSDLPQKAQKKFPVVLWVNILGDLDYCLRKINQCSNQVIIPLEWGMRYWQVLLDSLKILFFRIKLPKKQNFRFINIHKIFEFECLYTADKIQPYQLFHYAALKNLLDTINVNTFVLSFENYPWERQCLHCLKKNSPKTKCIGYQHTIVPQAALGMFPGKGDEGILPMPDQILTVGEATKNIILNYGHWSDIPIDVVGAVRFQYLFGLEPCARQKDRRILLACEGNHDIYKMVNYVINQMGASEYQFVIRTHPILPVSMFEDKLDFKLKEYDNIEISQGYSVKEDVQRCAVTVYWGSSLGIEALWMGRPVIHYDAGNILSYDPLFECDHLHWRVGEQISLNEVLDEINSLSTKDFETRYKDAKCYLKQYFQPVKEETWEAFII